MRAMQRPPLHDSVPAHGVEVYPRPSGLHTRRSLSDPQLSAPGTQICDWQRPAAQAMPAPHVLAAHALPLAAQTRTLLTPTHSRALGTQTCGAQV